MSEASPEKAPIIGKSLKKHEADHNRRRSSGSGGSASKKRKKLYMRASDIIKQRNFEDPSAIETRGTTNILRVNRES